MNKFNPKIWTKAHMLTFYKYDLQVNDMYEDFNKTIQEYIDKPIIEIVKCIRMYPNGYV